MNESRTPSAQENHVPACPAPSSMGQAGPQGQTGPREKRRTVIAECVKVARQIEADAFAPDDQDMVMEIVRNVAVVNCLPDTLTVRIEGQDLPAAMVREVYDLLRYEHVANVIDRFRQCGHIDRKVTYIRTMLFNAVLETAAGLINDMERY